LFAGTDRPMLSHEEARRFYDRFGAKQDWQRFYEDPAVRDLVSNLSLSTARSVVEFGCGTGRLAEALLSGHLRADGEYLAVDISATMVSLAQERLGRFGPRAKVLQTTGETTLDAPDAGFDRFLSTYVLDLLTEDDISSLILEAHRVLVSGGLIGLASLTHGFTALSKVVEKVWVSLHRLRPALVGGCRPIVLEQFIDNRWMIRHRGQTVSFGVPSEVLVAEKR
jgi:ubiquinone/menaquinone biosynthesis C-methylase UbiE